MADDRAQPFVSLTAKSEPEVRERRDVVPFIGDLTFVNASHELECRDGVFGRVAIKVWKLDNLRFHGDIGVGLNLSGQVSGVIVALDCWLDGLNLLLVENLLLVHDVCVFEVYPVWSVAERERMKVLVWRFVEKVSSFHFKVSAGSVIRKPVLYTNIVKRVSWFKSSLLLRINNKHTYKY